MCYKTSSLDEVEQLQYLKNNKCELNYNPNDKFNKKSCSKDIPICKNGVCATQKQVNHLKNKGCARDMNKNIDSYQHDKYTAEAPFCKGYIKNKQFGSCATEKQVEFLKKEGCVWNMDRKIDDNEKQKMKCTAEAPICKGHVAHTQFGSCATENQVEFLKKEGCVWIWIEK